MAMRMRLYAAMCTVTSTQQLEPNWTQISLAAARSGDRDAFATLVSPHTPKLQRIAHRLTRSAEDAEDICQESLLKAFTKLDQFSPTKTEAHEFCAWLATITRNCAVDFLRRKKAGNVVSLEDCPETPSLSPEAKTHWGESPEAAYTREEHFQIVREAIAALPVELQMVCLFRDLREFSTKEAAERLGISTIAVRLRLFRAHGHLRRILKQRTRRHVGQRRSATAKS
jgi:RNA polymerase sigma-70 factor (ECF subfamily)